MAPSITTWFRIEPRVRGTSLTGAQARVADPLWLLGRQWQVGEFAGEDAGSPIAAQLSASVARLSRLGFGRAPATGEGYDPDGAPLEVLVEREPEAPPAGGTRDVRAAAAAGLAFLRILDEMGAPQLRGAVLAAYPLAPLTAADAQRAGAAGSALAGVMAGRVPDGTALRHARRTIRGVPSGLPGVSRADQPALLGALARWEEELAAAEGSAAPGVPQAWDPNRLEYAFSVGARTAAGATTLAAPDYDGTRLDWDAFDAVPGPGLGAAADTAPATVVQTMLPVPVSYAGAPRRRWWEMEDSAVQFGSVEAGRDDLTRLLLMEFALVYGSDFFLVPLRLPIGSLTTIDALVVTDTFGGQWAIPSIGEVDGAAGQFRLFEIAPADPAMPFTARGSLLLAPTLPTGISGPAIEEVELVRDEMANLAWAVERTVPGADGRPLSRHEDTQRRAGLDADPDPVGPAQDAPLEYHLATLPPPHWLPLVTVRTTSNLTALELRTLRDDANLPQPPHGRLLVPGMLIADEEIPREGRLVTRGFEHVRWVGASSWTWAGRTSAVGRGEGSSGLRWDTADPAS